MAYGDYYNRERIRRPGPGYDAMGDLVDPGGPRIPGVTTSTGPTPPPADPSTLDRWGRPPGHRHYGRDPETITAGENTFPEGFGRNSDGSLPTNKLPNGPALPGAPPLPGQRKANTFTGGSLGYYGTGDIDGTEDLKAGNVGTLRGFNTNDWGSGKRGTRSIKNTTGMIFSRYPNKPSSIPLVLADPDFRALHPNAKQSGFDGIDLGDGKKIDVLENADPDKDTSTGWQWGVESDAVPEDAGAGMIAARGTTPTNTTQPVGTPVGINEEAYRPLARRDRRYQGPTMDDWFGNDEGYL